MKKWGFILGIASLFAFFAGPASPQDKATAQEVVKKVRGAAHYLATAGESAIPEFSRRTGPWVWKDTYVWVLDCDHLTNAAHPINPKLIGKDLSNLKDTHGNYIALQICDAAKNPQGGWVEYWWPKPGEKTPSRKISYVLQVPGIPYQVAAGIYNEEIPLEELEKLIK